MEEKPSITEKDVRRAKKAQLVEMCETCQLDTSGTKKELQERLLAYISKQITEELPEKEAEEPEEAKEEEAPEEEEITVEEIPEKEEVPAEEVKEEEAEEVPEEKVEEEIPEVEEKEEEPKEAPPVERPLEPPPERKPEEPKRIEIPPPPRKEIEHPCPTCGNELKYIDVYDRWYCYSCKAYAPREKEKVKAKPAAPPAKKRLCPTCSRPLRYVEMYDRWYCQSCGTYAPISIPEKKAPPRRGAEKVCTTCGRPLRYIVQYDRWYCDSCRAYEGVKKVEPRRPAAPPAERRCSTCGSMMKYIPKRRMYYCYTCQAYRPLRAPPRAVTVAVRPKPGGPPARPAAAERRARARPVVVKKDRTALVGSAMFILGLIFFIITGMLSLLVYSGSIRPISVYETGDYSLTLYGGISGIEVDTTSGQLTHTYNILLFLAIIFGGIGIILYGLSIAKWLPRIAQRR